MGIRIYSVMSRIYQRLDKVLEAAETIGHSESAQHSLSKENIKLERCEIPLQ